MSASGGRVVVVDAGIAGMLAARAVAGHADSVEILERDTLPTDPVPRGRVPQGRHIHQLLTAGLELLEGWFPGIGAELRGRGAVPLDGHTGWVHHGGAYRARGRWGPVLLSQTRPLLEEVLRARVLALPTVTLTDGRPVREVLLEDGRVRGVVVADSLLPADLVVDASGRSSRIVAELARTGLLDPPVTRVGIDIGYSSLLMRRHDDDFAGGFALCQQAGTMRGGAVVPVEPDHDGDRWQVTTMGVHGDVPPADREGLLAFARSLPSPTTAQLLERCEWLSPIETYRFPSSQWRHFEKADLPPGLVFLGDASCSFDPVYGQGMASAALQARALEQLAARGGVGAADLPKQFHRKAARVITTPWQIAVGGDFAHPQTVGARPPLATQVNAWTEQVIRAAHTSVPVARTFSGVLQLDSSPTALFSPQTVARTLVAARRSPVVTGEPVRHPRVG